LSGRLSGRDSAAMSMLESRITSTMPCLGSPHWHIFSNSLTCFSSLRSRFVWCLGSDAALKSRGNLCFFEDVWVEGFFAF
jgi:hypothetical protein